METKTKQSECGKLMALGKSIWFKYGEVCIDCGKTEPEVKLTRHHLKKNGKKTRHHLKKNGKKTGEFVVLCKNCHSKIEKYIFKDGKCDYCQRLISDHDATDIRICLRELSESHSGLLEEILPFYARQNNPNVGKN